MAIDSSYALVASVLIEHKCCENFTINYKRVVLEFNSVMFSAMP